MTEPRAASSPREPHAPRAGDSSFTRRDFLVRAGQMGAALSIAVPGFNRAWMRELEEYGLAPDSPPQQLAALHEGFRWRMLGPFRGGRTDAVTGVPGRPNEFYFGHVNGGVWKTIDGGRVWMPIFDSQPVASIGAIAVAPSAPDTVYVGTGESTLRDSVGLRQRHVQVDRRRTHLDAHRARRHAAHRQDRGRSAQSERAVRRGDRTSVRGEPGARRLPLARRRQDVAESLI